MTAVDGKRLMRISGDHCLSQVDFLSLQSAPAVHETEAEAWGCREVGTFDLDVFRMRPQFSLLSPVYITRA